MFLDDKVYNMYIHYIGKETIKPGMVNSTQSS